MLDDTREQLIGIPESPGTDSNKLNEPFGLCISNDGDLLYVADSKNRRIQVFKTSNGTYMSTIGSAVDFYKPFDVKFSSDNDCLLVSDMHNVKSIQILNHDIKIIALNGNGDNQCVKPMCICLSPDHNLLYISDTNKVKVFSTYMTGGRRKSTSSKRKTLSKRRNIKRQTLRMKRNRRTRQTRK
jgi:DNA-binding beta-propeller fold protein YncE